MIWISYILTAGWKDNKCREDHLSWKHNLQKKAWKIPVNQDHSSSPDLRSIYRCKALTNLASKQTGNWLLHELVRDKQGKKNYYNA